jgi:hypothetical protein
VKRLFLILAGVCIVASCGEVLDGGSACPALCPEQSLPIQHVVLDAVTFDTTVGAFPLLGTEPGLVLASRGDTLDMRAVARYDSLPDTFTLNGAAQPVTAVDSSRVFIRIDTAAVNFTGSVMLELYDVDTTAADTNTAAVVSLFRPDRLLGSRQIDRARLFLDDTISVPIPNSFVLAKVLAKARIRIGFRIVGAGDLTIRSVESGLPPALQFDPAPGNTSVASRSMGPISVTPANDIFLANDLRDYSLLVTAPPPASGRIVAGGLPATRAFLRLAIPSYYLDSVVIVRAQLSLVQRPLRGFADSDLATVYPVVVSTGPAVTDIRRASQLVYPAFSFGVSALALAPKDSGERLIDMVQLLRVWAAATAVKNRPQTAIVLRGANEGRAPGRLAFFGLDAPPELRPRLRLSYVARSRFGVP